MTRIYKDIFHEIQMSPLKHKRFKIQSFIYNNGSSKDCKYLKRVILRENIMWKLLTNSNNNSKVSKLL